MKESWDWDEEEIYDLLDNKIGESLTLEYKGARALSREKVQEITKDVSAFANSEGGTIVYGIKEDHEHQSGDLDDFNFAEGISVEWLDQILASNIHPKIKVRIKRIVTKKRSSGKVLYILHIPVGENVPHMASDNKYYNRREKRIEAMEDYQVRDSFNRKTSPDLHASFVPVVDYQKQFTKENCWSVKSMLYIENHSNTPAQYYAVKLFLNWRIDLIVTPSSYTSTNTIVQTPTGGSFKAHHFQWIKGIPGSFPVWKGTPLSFDELYLGIPEEYVGSELDFCWEISAPGMETKKYYGKLRMAGNLLMEVNQHE